TTTTTTTHNTQNHNHAIATTTTNGCEVLLLDMTIEACEKAKARLSGGKAPVVSDSTVLESIKVGTFDDNLQDIAGHDWICEVIVEDVAIKRDMFTKVEAHRSEGSIVTTNTSGIPLRDIYTGMPERLQEDIAVTHFFNPVHIMKLVELIPGEQTRPEVITTLADFLGNTLGKGVVYAKDTVNFIGNRIGCFWMLAGLHLAEDAMKNDGMSIEAVDAVMSAPSGLPGTGMYGLIDLIGLDVMFNVGRNLEINLPEDDMGRRFTAFTDSVQKIYDRGQLGRKTGGGFYKLTRHDDGSKTMEVFDLVNDAWRPIEPVTLPDAENTLPGLFASDSAAARFTKSAWATTFHYTADLVPDISDDIVNIDRAMRWGFGWKKGPFEMMDGLGAGTVLSAFADAGLEVPKMYKVMQAAEAERFYSDDGNRYLGTSGEWLDMPS
ncbi:MAG: 3-hydroxyacyl-CoA dehydrogenase NAD-binding domain-containing protein, partial [Pseudomonadota bacterium]